MKTKKTIKKVSFVILFAVIFSAFMFNFTVSAETKAAQEGAYIKYTVDINKPDGETLAYNFFNMKQIDYVIQAGDMIEYDVYITVEEAGWGAVDGNATTPTGNLRDTGSVDTDGASIHTGSDVSFFAYEKWYHRTLEIGDNENCVGQTINQFQIASHPNNDEASYQGIALYDNIVITNKGEVKLVIFKDEGDWIPDQVKLNHEKDCTATLEVLVFTAEEMQAFIDAEEAAIKAQEEKEAAKAEAEALRQASVEQASIDAALAAEQAANETEVLSEDANGDGSEADTTNSSDSDDEKSINVLLIVGIVAGVLVIIIIVVVVVSSKKKQK